MLQGSMKKSSSALRRAVVGYLPLALLLPSCTPEGYDPTKNMGRADGSDVEKFVVVSDGEVDAAALGKLGRYIRSQRQLNRSEEQILQSLVTKQIGGYRFERLRVLEQKKAAATRRHETASAASASKHQVRVERIRKSPLPAPEIARQLESADREQATETRTEEATLKRELVLIDTEIERERRKVYVVPVTDPKGAKSRSVVLIDANNRIRESKVYQIDRSIVDLAKVAARDEPEVAVLSDVPPLRLPGGP